MIQLKVLSLLSDNMKTLLILVFLLPTVLLAQQVGQFSQYMSNKYLLNPAAFFDNGKTDINLNYRNQWAGFEGSPKAYALSFQHHLAERKFISYEQLSLHTSSKKPRKIVKTLTHSIGGIITQDNFSPFKKTSVFGSYNVNIPLSKKHYFSAGASGGITSFQVDLEQTAVYDQSDELYNSFVVENGKSTSADLNLGFYFHTKKYYVGYSIFQLAPNLIKLGNSSDLTMNTNHFVIAGYYYDLNDKIQLSPSALMKTTFSSPATFDLNLIAKYNKMFWGGFGYRTNDALIALLGVDLPTGLKVSYSYDFTVSGFKQQTFGSHEITIGYTIKDNNNKRGYRRRQR